MVGITITTGTNEIIFYYEKVDGLTYTVEYLEKDTNKEISLPKVVDGKVYGDELTESAIDIDGYVKVEPTSETITIGMNENIIKFYYTKRTDLSYTVKYIDQETGHRQQKRRPVCHPVLLSFGNHRRRCDSGRSAQAAQTQ